MRLLVTGATGFVGRAVLPAVVGRFDEVHAVARNRPAESPDGVVFHPADVLDPVQAARLFAEVRPTHLLHLAWVAKPGAFWTSPENLDWLAASVRLLRAFAEAGGRRFVGVGTVAEYDWTALPPDGLCDESATPLRPATLYGSAKDALCRTLAAFAKTAGLSWAWGRLFWLHGPHEPPGRLVSSVADALRSGWPAECSAGTQRRDFLHTSDAAAALAALTASPVEGVVNIGSGRAVAVADLVTRFAERLGRPDLLRLGARPTPPGEPPVIAATTRRLCDEVGWSPRLGWEEGIAETAEWWKGRT